MGTIDPLVYKQRMKDIANEQLADQHRQCGTDAPDFCKPDFFKPEFIEGEFEVVDEPKRIRGGGFFGIGDPAMDRILGCPNSEDGE